MTTTDLAHERALAHKEEMLAKHSDAYANGEMLLLSAEFRERD